MQSFISVRDPISAVRTNRVSTGCLTVVYQTLLFRVRDSANREWRVGKQFDLSHTFAGRPYLVLQRGRIRRYFFNIHGACLVVFLGPGHIACNWSCLELQDDLLGFLARTPTTRALNQLRYFLKCLHSGRVTANMTPISQSAWSLQTQC